MWNKEIKTIILYGSVYDLVNSYNIIILCSYSLNKFIIRKEIKKVKIMKKKIKEKKGDYWINLI